MSAPRWPTALTIGYCPLAFPVRWSKPGGGEAA